MHILQIWQKKALLKEREKHDPGSLMQIIKVCVIDCLGIGISRLLSMINVSTSTTLLVIACVYVGSEFTNTADFYYGSPTGTVIRVFGSVLLTCFLPNSLRQNSDRSNFCVIFKETFTRCKLRCELQRWPVDGVAYRVWSTLVFFRSVGRRHGWIPQVHSFRSEGDWEWWRGKWGRCRSVSGWQLKREKGL